MTWNLARGEGFLPRTSLSELKQLMQAEPKAKPRLRFLIALHRKQGNALDEIVEACGLPRRTVHGTLTRFAEQGITAAHAVKQTGRPKRLKQAQLRDLRKRLLRSPQQNGYRESFWTTRMILSLVKRAYRVAYDVSHLRRLLHALGFSYKKPRPTNPRRAPDEEVIKFKKKRDVWCWLPDARAVPSS
mgnify:CR=1 FL=1